MSTVADIWFSPVPFFVDLTVESNRRCFISVVGGAQNLGTDGSAPFGVTPPVFLTSNGTPASFATNNGRGGSLTVSGGTLTAGATNPPGSSETTVTTQPASFGAGVLGDSSSGNLYAFNPKTMTDNGTARRWLRRWRGLPAPSEAAERFSALTVDMQTGAGVPDGDHPHVSLRWSDDGGYTWSDERIMSVGRLGSTIKTVKFNRLGTTRRFKSSDRTFELSSDDPFLVAILGADVEV
jgi:hypothetical protein